MPIRSRIFDEIAALLSVPGHIAPQKRIHARTEEQLAALPAKDMPKLVDVAAWLVKTLGRWQSGQMAYGRAATRVGRMMVSRGKL